MARRSDEWVALMCSFRDSEKLAGVSFAAECLYVRLLALAQDDGLLPGSPDELLWKCFAPHARTGRATAESVRTWLSELVDAGLVVPYEARGVPWIALASVARYTRQGRRRISDTPSPPWPIWDDDDDCLAGGLKVANRRAPEWSRARASAAPAASPTGSAQDPPRIAIGSSSDPAPTAAPAPPPKEPSPPRSAASKRAPKPAPEEVLGLEFPGLAARPGVRRAWSEWCAYRREKRKAVSTAAARRQLGTAAYWTAEEFVEAVEVSIASDWQGLFRPKDERNGRGGRTGGVGAAGDRGGCEEELRTPRVF